MIDASRALIVALAAGAEEVVGGRQNYPAKALGELRLCGQKIPNDGGRLW
jgi:hypothetical protein